MTTTVCSFDLADYLVTRPATYDPWFDICRRDGVDIAWHLPGSDAKYENAWGLTDFRDLRITLRTGLDGPELRCTLAHELLHLERGPFDRANGGEDREEEEIRLLVAHRLVDPTLLACLAAREKSPSWRQIYAMLDVDEPTFREYMKWRTGVSKAAAEAAWEKHGLAPSRDEWPAWPPRWVAEYAPTPWTEPLIARLESAR